MFIYPILVHLSSCSFITFFVYHIPVIFSSYLSIIFLFIYYVVFITFFSFIIHYPRYTCSSVFLFIMISYSYSLIIVLFIYHIPFISLFIYHIPIRLLHSCLSHFWPFITFLLITFLFIFFLSSALVYSLYCLSHSCSYSWTFFNLISVHIFFVYHISVHLSSLLFLVYHIPVHLFCFSFLFILFCSFTFYLSYIIILLIYPFFITLCSFIFIISLLIYLLSSNSVHPSLLSYSTSFITFLLIYHPQRDSRVTENQRNRKQAFAFTIGSETPFIVDCSLPVLSLSPCLLCWK